MIVLDEEPCAFTPNDREGSPEAGGDLPALSLWYTVTVKQDLEARGYRHQACETRLGAG